MLLVDEMDAGGIWANCLSREVLGKWILGGFKKRGSALRTVQRAPLDKHSLSKGALVLSLELHPPDVLKPSKTKSLKQYLHTTDRRVFDICHLAGIDSHQTRQPGKQPRKVAEPEKKIEKEFPAVRWKKI